MTIKIFKNICNNKLKKNFYQLSRRI